MTGCRRRRASCPSRARGGDISWMLGGDVAAASAQHVRLPSRPSNVPSASRSLFLFVSYFAGCLFCRAPCLPSAVDAGPYPRPLVGRAPSGDPAGHPRGQTRRLISLRVHWLLLVEAGGVEHTAGDEAGVVSLTAARKHAEKHPLPQPQ